MHHLTFSGKIAPTLEIPSCAPGHEYNSDHSVKQRPEAVCPVGLCSWCFNKKNSKNKIADHRNTTESFRSQDF